MISADLARSIALAVHGPRTLEDLVAEVQGVLLATGCGPSFSVLFTSNADTVLSVCLSTWPGLMPGVAFPLGADLAGQAARHGRRVRAENDPPLARWGATDVPLAAAFPLEHRGERFGALVLHEAVPAELMEAGEVLAEQLALSLVRVQLLEETIRSRQVDAAKLAAIAATGELLRQFDLEVILVKTVELALSIVSAEVGSLMLIEEGKGLRNRVEWGLPEDAIGKVRFADGGARAIDWVVEHRDSLLISDFAQDLRFTQAGMDGVFSNLLVIPLATRERPLGCINIVNSASGTFTRQDQDVLMTIAGLASTAIENALLHQAALEKERFREQLRLAGEIQQKLLPATAPAIGGGAIAGYNRPCDESGGDYYDFFRLDEHRTAFCVGDVTGHGIVAALLMTTARAFLRAYVSVYDDLGVLFARLNDLLVKDMGGDRFITLFFGVYDARSGTLRYTSAGHDPAILYRRASASFEFLDSTGMPMGMIEGIDFPPLEIGGLADGDLLLSTTDGVMEAMNPANQTLDRERVLEVVQQHRDGSPAALLEAINDRVKAWSETAAQRDDITMVCLRVQRGDGVATA